MYGLFTSDSQISLVFVTTTYASDPLPSDLASTLHRREDLISLEDGALHPYRQNHQALGLLDLGARGAGLDSAEGRQQIQPPRDWQAALDHVGDEAGHVRRHLSKRDPKTCRHDVVMQLVEVPARVLPPGA